MSRRRHLTRAVGWATINQRARLPRLAIFLSRGPVAQLGARFHGMEEVVGSIPTRSTNSPNSLDRTNACLLAGGETPGYSFIAEKSSCPR